MFGMIDGTWNRGGQRRRWIDDIREWTELTLGQLQRIAVVVEYINLMLHLVLKWWTGSGHLLMSST